MRAKTKLPYDIPYDIYETLKADAEKMEMPATQLLINLIEENHFKLLNENDFACSLDYLQVFKTMNMDQREVTFWYGAKCRTLPKHSYIDLSMKLIRVNEEEKMQIIKDRE